ncbi:Thylakoid lumenal 15.0 kDa protein [Rhynchospora pubera]|uniref:Thylakoid lumenal 15.0 kDa protein n=1 Tax=Rhynchospora pubera TaxID=906938 RepID=A0AAV8BVM0_9POAL|nr:Thylakoid lumenal 15.0 kDa protein [Rhynchospora pubera]KAJ4800654.1 Thylakoid lumenal 15.0 kDa protein [Rhynchospora pubera]
MALAFQSSSLSLKPQLFSAPEWKRQTRRCCFPSIIASSTKQNSPQFQKRFQTITSKALQFALSGALALGISLSGAQLVEAKVGVNKPELLPKEFTTVIDVAGFLSTGQEKRLIQEIEDLEKDTGFKLRILAQNYPDTPGLAIKDFWQVDDRTIVFVADPTFGNIINFNVGSLVDLDVPRSFWNRLAGKYGNMFYWKEQGEDASIEAAVKAISHCLREPVGPNNCSELL